MPFQQHHLDVAFHQLHQLVERYSLQHPLPTSITAVLREICTLVDEIDLCQREGYAPDHKEIPWRIAHLMLLICQVERAGLAADAARTLAMHFLESTDVSLSCALEIAQIRLTSLCRQEDIEQVDVRVLVPLVRRSLRQR